MPKINLHPELDQPSSVNEIDSPILHGDYILNEAALDRELNPANISFRETLNGCGASVEDAARTIAKVMKTAKYENTQLKAAEIALDLHGIRDKEGKNQIQPVFQFNIGGNSAINLNQIFSPRRKALDSNLSKIIDSLPDNPEDSNGGWGSDFSADEPGEKPKKVLGQYFPGF